MKIEVSLGCVEGKCSDTASDTLLIFFKKISTWHKTTPEKEFSLLTLQRCLFVPV
jgi:hypothetical protein